MSTINYTAKEYISPEAIVIDVDTQNIMDLVIGSADTSDSLSKEGSVSDFDNDEETEQ